MRRLTRLTTVALVALCLTPAAATRRASGADPSAPDWMMAIPLSDSSAPIRPADGARVVQSPPDFSWPDRGPDARYRVTLRYPDGRSRSRTAPQNWINWDEILPPGSYRWQVQVADARGSGVSGWRRFTVDANARPFLVPDAATLYDRATARAHPRALPDPTALAAMLAQRHSGLVSLLPQISALSRAALPPEPAEGPEQVIESAAIDEARRTLGALLAYVATAGEEHYREALRRALNLAAWNPRGRTSYASVDQASRLIAWTLTLAYDWLNPRLDAGQRQLLLAPLRVRIDDMYRDVIGSRARVAIHPYDSHGNHTLTFLAAMAAVLAGDIPEAQRWMSDALPLALHWISPWGGEDGGFGNGTAYAQWVTGDCLGAWYALRWTVGVDVAQKAWVRNYARYLAYFLPPGTPAGVFGDGAEARLTEDWARFGKGYTWFAPSALGRWYASQLQGEDASRLEILLAPPADRGAAPYPAGTENSALFASIGWAAMHSDLEDPARVSIYFKSSFYASYNHSHADQNSFVVNAGGEALAIDSGYYDGYRTPHWWQWYKQTRAHNAITFDGGQGQVVFEEANRHAPGAIVRAEFKTSHDVVTGDATAAYGGALTQAVRSLVYLRPNLLLVHDRLASAIPRQWEWNLHALQRMEVDDGGRVTIRSGGEKLCIEMLAGPPTAFTQTNRFAAPPSGRNLPPQWHGAYVSRARSTAAEFVALLRVGCQAVPASATRANGAWSVKVAGRTVTFGEQAITVSN
jgi:hypothetical protein